MEYTIKQIQNIIKQNEIDLSSWGLDTSNFTDTDFKEIIGLLKRLRQLKRELKNRGE